MVQKKYDAQELMQNAQAQQGLADYGDKKFVPALEKLLQCVSSDTTFHPQGAAEFEQDILRILGNRLRFEHDKARYPEILEEDVTDPIIILGLPRSGTTKMQRMMAVDTSLLKTYMWQLLHPAPLVDIQDGQPDPRILAAAGGDHVADNNDDVQAGHHMAINQVDEDWMLFEHTFNDWFNNNRNPSLSWHEWVMARQEPTNLDNYEYVYSIVQYLQWQQGGRNGRRWLLKSCGHLAYMPDLINVFPNATLVHIHRHPYACVPSLCKLLDVVWGLRVQDVDPHLVGKIVLDWEGIAIQRYLKSRENPTPNSRIFDVPYERVRNDPFPVIEEIYRRAGHNFTAQARVAMQEWEIDNEQGKHGKHVYTLEHYGLSEEKIDEKFSGYISRFL